MGMAFAFAWTPCIGPVLGVVLSLAARNGTLPGGVLLLFAYSLGLAVPFVLVGLAFNRLTTMLARTRHWLWAVELVAGVVLVVFGVLLLTDNVSWVSTQLSNLLERHRPGPAEQELMCRLLTVPPVGPARADRRERPGERERIARPAGRDIGAVAHDPRRPLVGQRVPGAPARLAPPVGCVLLDVLEVGGIGQRPCDLLLHRHVAPRLPGLLHVGPVVVGVPEARVPGDPPRLALQRPGERGRPAAVEHGVPRRRVDRACRHEDAVADRPDRPGRPEGVDRHLLHLGALQVRAHATCTMPAGKEQRVVGAAPGRPPVER